MSGRQRVKRWIHIADSWTDEEKEEILKYLIKLLGKEERRKRRTLLKTLFYRGIVITTAVVSPRLLFGSWDISPFTLTLALIFTIGYYLNEKLWEILK